VTPLELDFDDLEFQAQGKSSFSAAQEFVPGEESSLLFENFSPLLTPTEALRKSVQISFPPQSSLRRQSSDIAEGKVMRPRSRLIEPKILEAPQKYIFPISPGDCTSDPITSMLASLTASSHATSPVQILSPSKSQIEAWRVQSVPLEHNNAKKTIESQVSLLLFMTYCTSFLFVIELQNSEAFARYCDWGALSPQWWYEQYCRTSFPERTS
jgi:hypothetical protein